MNSFDNVSCEEYYQSENDWADYDNYLASVLEEDMKIMDEELLQETKNTCTRCGCVDDTLEYVTSGRSLCFDCYEACAE